MEMDNIVKDIFKKCRYILIPFRKDQFNDFATFYGKVI